MKPLVLYDDLRAAIPWLCRAFGLRPRARRASPDGTLLAAELQLDCGVIALAAAPAPAARRRRPLDGARIFFLVADVDGHFARATQAGAQIVFPPEDRPWGLRRYETLDVEGHRWQFNQHLRDVAPAAWGAIAGRSVHPFAGGGAA